MRNLTVYVKTHTTVYVQYQFGETLNLFFFLLLGPTLIKIYSFTVVGRGKFLAMTN